MVGIDTQLQVGQAVSLRDHLQGYQIAILPPDQPGLRIVEIGVDFVVIDDADAGVKTRIPAHLLLPLNMELPPAAASTVPEIPQAA